MDLKIREQQTGHLMTDLDIPQHRCSELCDVVEQSIHGLHNEGTDKVTLAQVLKKSLVHAKNDNETVFISCIAGEYHANYMQHVAGMQLSEIFSGMKETFATAN